MRDTEVAIFRNTYFRRKKLFFLLHSRNVSNSFFYKLLSDRYFCIPYSIFSRALIRALSSKLGRTIFNPEDTSIDLNILELLHKEKSLLGLQIENLDLDSNAVKQNVGLVPSKPYIAFVFRDSRYDNIVNPSKSFDQRYRHTPVSYVPALLNLMSSFDYQVVRMGRYTYPLEVESKFRNFFDYSQQTENQSDSNDFILFNECQYVVSTGSGIDEIGALFRKKICLINFAPPNTPLDKHIYPFVLSSDYFLEQSKLSIRKLILTTNGKLHPRDIPVETQIEIRPKPIHLVLEFVKLFHEYHEYQHMDVVKHFKQFAGDNSLEMVGNVIY